MVSAKIYTTIKKLGYFDPHAYKLRNFPGKNHQHNDLETWILSVEIIGHLPLKCKNHGNHCGKHFG